MRLPGPHLRLLSRSLSQLRYNAACLQPLTPYHVSPSPRSRSAVFGMPHAKLHELSRRVEEDEVLGGQSYSPLLRRRLGFGLEHSRGFLSIDGDDEGLSKHYEETRLIGYSPEQLYAVVAAVELYQDFVPWCQRSTILWRKGGEALEAELQIGFKFLTERYISHVTMSRPNFVKTTSSQSTLFEHLKNEWTFKPGPTPHSTELHFMVDFQFRSPLYRKVSHLFFNEVVAKLVSSFEDRCRHVYGPSVDVMKRK